ncbi:WXG100 family type VII secretion target [Propionibacteriaceae bacterium Y1685]|uniref:WXG100 family type VII secretion target n=1 Tax=Microlunatus sp. Y1700 TaxID=3418487 RepID=UPI003B77E5D5
MSNTSVNRASMTKAAGQIDAALTTIAKTQTNLQQSVQELTARGWTGNAAQAFLKGFTEFDNQFTTVKNELDGIHSKLTDSQTQYSRNEAEQEEASSAIFQALQG